MGSPTERFSNRVDDYVTSRPSYPRSILHLMTEDCGLTPGSLVADVGSGTGLLAEIFLENGNRVVGVEPNEAMRRAGKAYLEHYAQFWSLAGKAEATALRSNCIDFITAGQAFHWFELLPTRSEFRRILRSDGWVVLIWNQRRTETTPFLRDYERLLQDFGTDYQQVIQVHTDSQRIASFFQNQPVSHQSFENRQKLDFPSLRGRLLSSSYIPLSDSPRFSEMLIRLQDIFARYAQQGTVSMDYDTEVFYRQLAD